MRWLLHVVLGRHQWVDRTDGIPGSPYRLRLPQDCIGCRAERYLLHGDGRPDGSVWYSIDPNDPRPQ